METVRLVDENDSLSINSDNDANLNDYLFRLRKNRRYQDDSVSPTTKTRFLFNMIFNKIRTSSKATEQNSLEVDEFLSSTNNNNNDTIEQQQETMIGGSGGTTSTLLNKKNNKFNNNYNKKRNDLK